MLLFYGYLENPTPEEMHKAYRDQSTGPSIDKREADNLKKLGYSDEKIARMKEELKKAGL